LNGGAIGVCYNSFFLVVGYGVRIYLWDHQRDIGIHTPSAGVVNYHAAGIGSCRGKFSTRPSACREKGYVQSLKRICTEFLNGQLLTTKLKGLSDRAGRCQELEGSYREFQLL